VPSVPAQRSDTVKTVTSLGAQKARKQVAAQKAANKKQINAALAEQKATWPHAATDTAELPPSGTAGLSAGGLPITVRRDKGTRAAAGSVTVTVLSRKAAAAAGIKGVLLTASAESSGSAQVDVDYSAFASAYGGDWAGRLHLVRLPNCALTSPAKAACRAQTSLNSRNDVTGQNVSATVPLGQTSLPRADERASRSGFRSSALTQETASSATVLALTATSGESASGSGNYSATPLSPSSSWQAGGSSGAFTWNYPLSTPPAAAGPSPTLSLDYDSGSTDGKTASTNNQSTQVGEGFDLTAASYVERSYASCDDDGQTDKHDLCWKYDNASLVLNGKSTELVKDDTTGAWHLKDDDASTVTHSTGGDNGDNDGEYWTVTTADGTKYVFGLDKLPGADTQRTNSVWTVPVFGDDSGEPGYDQGSSFADRSLTQAWRWNLDYVVDLHGNAMSYWYTAEANYYPKNGASTANAAYTRGGYLTKILYGQRASTLFTGTASDEVTFSYDERCTASDCSSLTSSTSDNWPDVPYDSICASGADDCDTSSPTFFTRKRLTGINTLAYSAAGSAYTAVDSWTLTQKFLDGQDIDNTSDQTLALSSIRHTGKNGSDIALPPVTFTYQLRPNRVDSTSDDILPLSMPRIASITSETGAITTVTLSDPECVRGSNMPASEDKDTLSCYPQYWHINGATEASLDWFNKYRVTAVLSSDPTGLGQGVQTSYSYADPAWHYNYDPLVPSDERTWSQWRGYGKVTTTTGAADTTQSKTVSIYMQGMDGDRQSDGSTASATRTGLDVSGLDVPDLADSDQDAGFLREQVTYDGDTPVTVTVDTPWSQQTASQQKSYAAIKAYYLRTGQTSTSTYLTNSATWRTRTTSTSYDDYGMVTQVNDTGQTGVSGDNTCTRTWYARNTAIGLTGLVSRTRVVGQDCSVAESSLALPTSSASRGDVLSDTATVYDNTSATAWSATQTPTLGEATWTGRASAYPASTTNGERYPTTWQTVATTTYDDSGSTTGLGRPLTVTDAAGNTTTTTYTPTDAGPLTKTKVTNAKSQNTYVYTDYGSGCPPRSTTSTTRSPRRHTTHSADRPRPGYPTAPTQRARPRTTPTPTASPAMPRPGRRPPRSKPTGPPTTPPTRSTTPCCEPSRRRPPPPTAAACSPTPATTAGAWPTRPTRTSSTPRRCPTAPTRGPSTGARPSRPRPSTTARAGPPATACTCTASRSGPPPPATPATPSRRAHRTAARRPEPSPTSSAARLRSAPTRAPIRPTRPTAPGPEPPTRPPSTPTRWTAVPPPSPGRTAPSGPTDTTSSAGRPHQPTPTWAPRPPPTRTSTRRPPPPTLAAANCSTDTTCWAARPTSGRPRRRTRTNSPTGTTTPLPRASSTTRSATSAAPRAVPTPARSLATTASTTPPEPN
jgi:hypothetical protein